MKISAKDRHDLCYDRKMRRCLLYVFIILGSGLMINTNVEAYEMQYCKSRYEHSSIETKKSKYSTWTSCQTVDRRDNPGLYEELLRKRQRATNPSYPHTYFISTKTLERAIQTYAKKPESNVQTNLEIENEKRKIAEEKKRIEEEKKRIAEAKKNIKKTDEKIFVIGSGTGFFVSTNGHAISNDHVVGICKKVAAKIKGKVIYFNVLSTDKINDLGLIKAKHSSQNYLSIKSSGAEYGEDIVAFGYPLSDALSSSVKLTRGIVSALSGPGNNYSEIQIDAAIQPGNSGGPVMNMEGQVVGVASSGLNKLRMLEQTEYIPENVNFAVAAPTLVNFLKSNGIITRNRSYRIKNTKQLAKVGRPATLQLFCLNTKSEFEKLKKQKKHSDVLLEKVVEFK